MNQVDNILKLSLTNKKSQFMDNNINNELFNQWEQNLQKKEIQLIQKEKKLKEKENQLSQKEDLLVKKELDLNQRMIKYSTILEQIIAQKQIKQDISLLPNDRSHRNKNINEYQNRVINLLNTIRSNSQQQQQLIHQQSYMGSTLELIDDKFNKSSRVFQLL